MNTMQIKRRLLRLERRFAPAETECARTTVIEFVGVGPTGKTFWSADSGGRIWQRRAKEGAAAFERRVLAAVNKQPGPPGIVYFHRDRVTEPTGSRLR